METVKSIGEKTTGMALGEMIRARFTITEIMDQWRLDSSAGSFYIQEFGDTLWFFDLIKSYQSSSALEGARHQTWSIQKVGYGKLQILCRDRFGDVLIARLIRRRFPLSELTVVFVNN